MATLYFNDAEADGDWANWDNWWQDESGIIPGAVPTASDDAILLASCTGSGAVCNTMSMPDALNEGHVFSGDLTTQAGATFGGASFPTGATIYGGATFNDNSVNQADIYGGAVFNDSSYNGSGVYDGAVFNDNSYNNNGTVNGGAVFWGVSYNSGTVYGGAVFNDSSYNDSTVNDGAVFNGGSYNSNGTVNGGAVFNDTAYNSGTCDTAIYSATAAAYQLASSLAGTVSGSCTVRIGINGSSVLGLP